LVTLAADIIQCGQKRHVLEETNQLDPRTSGLDDDLEEMDEEEEEEEKPHKVAT
jgi:pre-mRNA-splicing factor 38A